MLIAGGFCRYTRIPGTVASFRPSSWITSSALSFRSERGLRCMKMRPWLTVVFRPPADALF